MTDLDLIVALRPDFPLATPGELAQARSRLTAGIAAQTLERGAAQGPGGDAHRPGAARKRARPGWLRLSRRSGLAGLAAAAAAVGVTLALTGPGQGGAPSVVPTGPGGVNGQVATFLDNAASAVRRQPGTVPRASQFIYAETVDQGYRGEYQIWQSVTGQRPGLIINSTGRSPLPPCSLARARTGACQTTAGYLPDFPTQPGRVLSYLVRIGAASKSDEPGGGMPVQWIANDLGKTIDMLLLDTYLLPAQRAALYEFMARTPGFYPVPHAADAIGRPGFGIGWNYMGARAMVIFSARTFAYLGDRTWPAPGSGVSGRQYDGSALVKSAIVNRAGQT